MSIPVLLDRLVGLWSSQIDDEAAIRTIRAQVRIEDGKGTWKAPGATILRDDILDYVDRRQANSEGLQEIVVRLATIDDVIVPDDPDPNPDPDPDPDTDPDPDPEPTPGPTLLDTAPLIIDGEEFTFRTAGPPPEERTVKPTHPRLILPDNLDELREKLADPVYDADMRFLRGDEKSLLNRVLTWWIAGGSAIPLIQELLEFNTSRRPRASEFLTPILAYDWLAVWMTDEEKQQAFNVICDLFGIVPPEPGETAMVFEDDFDTLTAKGYIFARTYSGVDGVYFDNSATCILASSDFAFIENNRTIDKAATNIIVKLTPRLNGPVLVDPTSGELAPDYIAQLEADGNAALDGMLEDVEISGKDVFVDPAQDVNATGKILVKFKIVPIGVSREIEAEIGFAAQI